MPDVYVSIATADEAVQERLAEVLELRAAEPAQQAMLGDYLADVALPDGARVLEVGCGTGVVARTVAARPGVGEVVGLDPSPVFVAHAQRLAEGVAHLSYVVGSGTALPFEAGAFDAVIFHTVLSHIPDAGAALAEAARVTVAGGALAVFDGDYATTTVAVGDHDPLQACADAAMAALVHDRHLVRRLGTLVRAAGWDVERLRSHGYVENEEPGYILTLIDRGADTLVASGRLGEPAADALKAEARRRVAAGEFFGHIAYVSLIARRPQAGPMRRESQEVS
ncbi:MAG: methyltransferase domain-containing protein [Solirubrobacteraceae bacterium]